MTSHFRIPVQTDQHSIKPGNAIRIKTMHNSLYFFVSDIRTNKDQTGYLCFLITRQDDDCTTPPKPITGKETAHSKFSIVTSPIASKAYSVRFDQPLILEDRGYFEQTSIRDTIELEPNTRREIINNAKNMMRTAHKTTAAHPAITYFLKQYPNDRTASKKQAQQLGKLNGELSPG